jgi:hypothetical protein
MLFIHRPDYVKCVLLIGQLLAMRMPIGARRAARQDAGEDEVFFGPQINAYCRSREAGGGKKSGREAKAGIAMTRRRVVIATEERRDVRVAGSRGI